MLGARYEDAKERCLKVYKEEKRKVERCIYQSKKAVREQFGRKMNQYVNGNRKLFWKELNKANGTFIYLFCYGLTSICDPMADTLISYHRGGSCVTCKRKTFSQTYNR